MNMSVSVYDDFVLPFYTRVNTVNGNTPADFSKAAFLTFIAEFPEIPLSSADVEYLKRCFEDHFKQD
jgi:hypothetical protein